MRLLDLFCGAGGAAMGYHRAGFDVVGVDHRPQPNYPFEFIEDDALEVLQRRLPFGFDAIHASPPCQAYSHAGWLGNRRRNDHPRLIAQTRELLNATGLPYVIENVEDARPELQEPATICGTSLGLSVKRHRLFESNIALMVPPCACGYWQEARYPSTPRADGTRPLSRFVNPMASGVTHQDLAAAMEIDWMPAPLGQRPRQDLREAIPPAYTELIGHQLMQHVQAAA